MSSTDIKNSMHTIVSDKHQAELIIGINGCRQDDVIVGAPGFKRTDYLYFSPSSCFPRRSGELPKSLPHGALQQSQMRLTSSRLS